MMKLFYKQNYESISFEKLVRINFFLLLISLDFFFPKSLFTENFTNSESNEKGMKTVKKVFELSKNWTEYN